MTRPLQPVKCKHCQREFRPRLARYTSYCSRDCSFAHRAAAPYCPVHISHCSSCGNLFASQTKRLYCSDACRPSAKWVSIAPDAKRCLACDAEYKPVSTGGAPSDYCSSGCRDRVAAAHKRVEKAKRKALIASVTVENVDPLKVFERDRWRCQLCKAKTPKAKRGTYDNDAPELDHIVPLAKGGEHSYRNTQCACRKCNGLKSDRALGQLLLIG